MIRFIKEDILFLLGGYLKLIDFGIAKKLEEGKTRTFTMNLGEEVLNFCLPMFFLV